MLYHVSRTSGIEVLKPGVSSHDLLTEEGEAHI